MLEQEVIEVHVLLFRGAQDARLRQAFSQRFPWAQQVNLEKLLSKTALFDEAWKEDRGGVGTILSFSRRIITST